MAYAEGRLFYDSDSHVMETLDWLERAATADEARLLGSISDAKNAGPGLIEQAVSRAAARRADPAATAQLLQAPIISGPKGWAAYGASTADERSHALDLLGFQKQLIFPTFSLGQFARSPDTEVLYAGARAMARAIGEFCGGDGRMLGVAYLPLKDAQAALDIIELGVKSGVKAFWVSADPPGDKSPTHVDFDPVWTRLCEHGKPIMLHIGAGKLAPPAFANNGRGKTTDWLGGGENLRARDFIAVSHAPQNFLTAMVLDGVFERHPDLRCGVIELGGTWVPAFLQILDQAARSFRKTEPLIGSLSMAPSEYIRRQVRISLFPFEDAGQLIRLAGEDLFMFASDYPHPEGSKDPIGRFEASLASASIAEPAKEKFYSANFAHLMAL